MLHIFRSWLVAKNYSESTVKNYVIDASRYLQTIASDSPVTHIFSPETVGNYLTQISSDINYPRYLASLNQFCQFAVSQQLCSQNPIKAAKKNVHSEPKIDLAVAVSQFGHYLTSHKSSSSTIKNYINDVTQYIHWLNSET